MLCHSRIEVGLIDACVLYTGEQSVLELVGYIAGLFYIPFKWRK